MVLYFITGNHNKFAEVKHFIQDCEMLDIDVDEIQELDQRKILERKLERAAKESGKMGIIVEDTALYIQSLNDLPGPLIKWFLKSLGTEGIYNLARDSSAEAVTMVGYKDKSGNNHFFTGSLKGNIVYPTGETNFGWDPIFKPLESDKTFQQMSKEEKNNISMRSIAFKSLADYLRLNSKAL